MSIENITEEIEQEEKYVPKAVLFQQSSGGQKLKAEMEEAEIEEQEIKDRIKKCNGFLTSVAKTKLFNITSLFYLGNIVSGVLLFMLFFVLAIALHPAVFAEPLPYEEVNQLMVVTIMGLLACCFFRTVSAFINFVGMRTLRDSAVRYEVKVSAEGATVMRVASWMRFVTSVIFAVSIVFSPEIILSDMIIAVFYLITDIVFKICTGRVRAAAAEGEMKKLPVVSVIICMAHAMLYAVASYMSPSIAELQYNYVIFAWVFGVLTAISAVSMVLLGVFIVYYNAKVGEYLKENN